MYVPLHNRSAYSFGSSLIRPEQLAAFAAHYGMPAIALTDWDGLYGAVAFQQACAKAGVKPIFGLELEIALQTPPLLKGSKRGQESLCRRHPSGRFAATTPNPFSVVLLAQSLRGYGNLCRLISRRHTREGPLTIADLCEHAGDVICIIGRSREHCSQSSGTLREFSGAARGTERVARDAAKHEELGAPSTLSTQHSVLSTQHFDALREAFRDRIYIELAIHCPEDVPVARKRAAWADELGIPVVATGESRCLNREDMPMLRALASIGTLTLLDRPHPEKPWGDAWHLRRPEEMQQLFARRPDALASTLKIAEQCNVTLDLDRNRFPAFASPDGRSAREHLRELCVAGCRRRYIETPPQKGMLRVCGRAGGQDACSPSACPPLRPTLEQALKRLDRELAIIDQVHYAEYFLVFHEIVQYCRSRGIATLARGSAADSLVCYALGVSHACPFRFDLPFDRFVNPERARFSKMADIDLDLPWDQRDEVINWVYERWGHDRVAMIGAPNTFHARAAMVELGKVFGLPAQEIHRVTKLLPHTAAWHLAGSIAASPESRDIPVAEEPYRTIIAVAGALEGLPRHWAMHPCGLVVSPEPITDLIPVQPSPKGPLVAQYDMDAIEDLGFIKIDLLGQAGLSVLRDTVAEIHRTGTAPTVCHCFVSSVAKSTADTAVAHGSGTVHVLPGCPATKVNRTIPARRGRSPSSEREWNERSRNGDSPLISPLVDLDRDVDYSDAATWELIASGNARGVHHIESPAMTSLIVQCNCRDIDCLTSIVALIRPGAANQGKKEAFCRRHQGFEPVSYAHPAVVPVLESTYGLMVFEEHILQIAVEFAGMNLGRADVLRRALNKENRPLIAEMKGEFRECALRQGRTSAEIDTVWAILDDFSGFMFNKAHSAEYAVEAFQGAWLKVRWPAHYLAAILSNYRGFYAHSPTLPQILYAMEALRLGIRLLPPCVNQSRSRFSVEIEKSTSRQVEKSQQEVARIGLESAGLSHFSFLTSHFPRPNSQFSTLNSQFIRVPVAHINGLSTEFAERWWAERQKGHFEELADFITRCRPGEAETRLLLDSGALDCFCDCRPAMFWQLRHLLRSGEEKSTIRKVETSKRGCEGDSRSPVSHFSLLTSQLSTLNSQFSGDHPPVALTRPDARAVAQREMELLGFLITIDPLTYLGSDEKGRQIEWSQYVPVSELGQHLGRQVRVCGLMVADRINATIKGELMKFVTLADHSGFVETMLFPDMYKRFGHLTVAHPILVATGIVEPFENGRGFTLRVTALAPPVMK